MTAKIREKRKRKGEGGNVKFAEDSCSRSYTKTTRADGELHRGPWCVPKSLMKCFKQSSQSRVKIIRSRDVEMRRGATKSVQKATGTGTVPENMKTDQSVPKL